MSMRIVVASLMVGAAVVHGAANARASELPVIDPAVVCAPSRAQTQPLAQTHSVTATTIQPLCLLRLSPLFARTTFEVTPQAAKKRWGAELEFRF